MLTHQRLAEVYHIVDDAPEVDLLVLDGQLALQVSQSTGIVIQCGNNSSMDRCKGKSRAWRLTRVCGTAYLDGETWKMPISAAISAVCAT